MDELHRRIAKRIRALAKARRIPLSHIPDRAGISRAHFWEVLGCRASPTIEWLGKIAAVLDADVEDLVTRTPHERAR